LQPSDIGTGPQTFGGIEMLLRFVPTGIGRESFGYSYVERPAFLDLEQQRQIGFAAPARVRCVRRFAARARDGHENFLVSPKRQRGSPIPIIDTRLATLADASG
jgi:hypothetical protein